LTFFAIGGGIFTAMKKATVLLCVLPGLYSFSVAQSKRDDIYSDFVLYNKRQLLFKDLNENVIGKTFSLPLDSNTEYKYEAACRAIVQFMWDKEITQQGLTQLFIKYDSLQFDTKRCHAGSGIRIVSLTIHSKHTIPVVERNPPGIVCHGCGVFPALRYFEGEYKFNSIPVVGTIPQLQYTTHTGGAGKIPEYIHPL
jgi:hypothetical protein